MIVITRLYYFLREIKHQLFYVVYGYAPTCKHNPSCSQYTLDEIQKNGTIIGILKGCWRVLRCW